MATDFSVEVDWFRVGGWTNETAYVQDLKIRLGFENPGDPAASVGRCTIILDNTTQRFSPGNSLGLLWGQLSPRRPVRISATSGGSTWVLFRGWIESLDIDTGLWGSKRCVLDCVDSIELLRREHVAVSYESSKTVATAVQALVASVYTPPATSYSNNGDTLSHYGRRWTPEDTSVWDALVDVCRAVAGRFFVARNGTTTYRSRSALQNPSVAAALTVDTSTAIDELIIQKQVNRIVNECLVTVYPVEKVGSSQVIWKAQDILRIAPGQSRIIYANFRDSDGQRCGAVSVTTPVATTDYLVNDRSDGTGFNYTTDPAFSISCVTESTRMKITLGNSATGPLYVTFFQIRGKPLRVYDPITIQKIDSGSQAEYEKRALSYDLPMQADTDFAQSLADYVIGRFKFPHMNAISLTIRDQDVINGVNIFGLELFSKLSITDDQTGAYELEHWIISAEYDIAPTGFEVRFGLERADERKYWLLGRSGYSELGSATRIGF